jgi:type I restriction enzyme, S subunit
MDFTPLDRARFLLKPGDLLVCEGGEVGRAAVWKGALAECYYQKAIHRLRPFSDNESPRFLFYVLQTAAKLGVFVAEGNQNTIDHLTAEKLRKHRFPFPSPGEQRSIICFLDRETAKIDALIAKKQRLIELLQEKRTALISHAVTKGLDSEVPMKDSGIGWLGQIPGHWDMKPLKFASDLQTGLTLGKDYQGRSTIDRPYLRVANVQDGYLDLETITRISVPVEDVGRYELRRGDVLMTEGGDFDKLGRGYVWEGQIEGCLHQNHIFAVRPYSTILDSRFLAFLMTSTHGKHYFTSTSQQTTNLASTNSVKIRGFPLPVPPKDEQTAIVKFLDRRLADISSLIDKVRSGVLYLREYRTALITSAVTGKIDVRVSGGQKLSHYRRAS